MRKIPRQEYVAQFNELAVKRVKDGQGKRISDAGLGVGSNEQRDQPKTYLGGIRLASKTGMAPSN